MWRTRFLVIIFFQWHHEKDYGESYKGSPESPISKRSCTDILCFLLFLAFLGGWGVVTFFAIQKGDISKVVYPTDTNVSVTLMILMILMSLIL